MGGRSREECVGFEDIANGDWRIVAYRLVFRYVVLHPTVYSVVE